MVVVFYNSVSLQESFKLLVHVVETSWTWISFILKLNKWVKTPVSFCSVALPLRTSAGMAWCGWLWHAQCKVVVYVLNRVQLCNPSTVARQAPLSMGFFLARTLERVAISSGGSSWPGTEAMSPALAGRFLTTKPQRKPLYFKYSSSSSFYSFKKVLDPVYVSFLVPICSSCFLGNSNSEEGRGNSTLRREPLQSPNSLLCAGQSSFSRAPSPLDLPSVVARVLSWDCPAGPVVGTLHSKWAGHRFNSWLGN